LPSFNIGLDRDLKHAWLQRLEAIRSGDLRSRRQKTEPKTHGDRKSDLRQPLPGSAFGSHSSPRILYVAIGRLLALMPGLDKVLHEQTRMLEAVCRGDGDAAERISLIHVLSFEEEVRKII
jgi:hypothetical protein